MNMEDLEHFRHRCSLMAEGEKRYPGMHLMIGYSRAANGFILLDTHGSEISIGRACPYCKEAMPGCPEDPKVWKPV